MNTPTHHDAIDLLCRIIEIPSMSGEEGGVADCLQAVLSDWGVQVQRMGNNVWAVNRFFDPKKENLLLNSHLDTVPAGKAWTRDPFKAVKEGDRLYGLGSNDAGGALVCLLFTFVSFFQREDLPCNLVFAGTAEEENSGPGGLASLLSHLPQTHTAIVGEPTEMNAALAERGLLVLEATTHGVAGHAARSGGDTAIDLAVDDLVTIRTLKFPKESSTLGPIKLSVNVIHAGKRHNVVPASCGYKIDVRLTDAMHADEVLSFLETNLNATLKVQSVRHCPPAMKPEHPLARSAAHSGAQLYISPTTSDRALIPVPTLKMAPGRSERSHTADEFILLSEIKNGLESYGVMLESYFQILKAQ